MTNEGDSNSRDVPRLGDVIMFVVGCLVATVGTLLSATVVVIVGIAVAIAGVIIPLRSLRRRSMESTGFHDQPAHGSNRHDAGDHGGSTFEP